MRPEAQTGGGPVPWVVRAELPGEVERVQVVHRAAFPTAAEADLVGALAEAGDRVPELCLVAEVSGRLIGSVVCSRGEVDGVEAVALAPVAVLQGWQSRGVGSALVRAVLVRAAQAGWPLVALLGDPGFYGRFGFVPSEDLGVAPPDPSWGEHFQVRPLVAPSKLPGGTFHYPAAFDGL